MAGKKQTARAAIYVRVSTLHQIDKDSLPMQRQNLIAYAKLMLNTEDYVIFEDAGYSGKNTDRPKYQEMMSQIRSGVFTHLLVWKIDRISRIVCVKLSLAGPILKRDTPLNPPFQGGLARNQAFPRP